MPTKVNLQPPPKKPVVATAVETKRATVSLDTETTGIDFRFGARPFYVTSCNDAGEVSFWEWDVDPMTREVYVPPEDIGEIWALIDANNLVLQNSKFDVTALSFIDPSFGTDWPWYKTDDTLVAGHVTASNRPHNLTDMAMQYLGVNILPLEKKLEVEVQAARRLARSKFPDWQIAKEDHPQMPSAGEKTWKYDMWLPKALWKESAEVRKSHPQWETVLRDYANADSEVTLPLFRQQYAEIQRRGLVEIYRERLKCMRLAYKLQTNGVTLSAERLAQDYDEFKTESDRQARICVNIAASYGHELKLPKGASPNDSLRSFCFGAKCENCKGEGLLEIDGVPGVSMCPECKGRGTDPKRPYLDLERITGTKSKTGAPSLAKDVLEHYTLTLATNGMPLRFIKSMIAKRQRDTAIGYMNAYRRFWVPAGDEPGWFRLHPNLNPTGSDTLRWTSDNPNEQNISKKEDFNVRRSFGPMPGREWWSLDAKNIELRLPFYESGEKALIALFERPDDPPYYGSNHLANFHAVYPDIWDEVLKEVGIEKVGPTCKKRFASTYYQWCKNGGFAKQYGGQRRKVDATFRRDGAFDLLDSKFARLADLNRSLIKFANIHGYVETIPDRSVNPKKGYPLLCTRTENGKILETVPLSYHIQGSAMWWTAKAMDRCNDRLELWKIEEGYDGFITLQVHDEMVFDLPKKGDPVAESKGEALPGSSNLQKIRVLQQLMEKGGDDFGIPTPVGVEFNPVNWAEGITL